MPDIPILKLNNGNRVPALGFGTSQIDDGQKAIGAVTEALQAGYRLIDTAKIYRNEQGVGEAVRKSSVPREEIFVTTKLWPADFGYDSALRAFDESLTRLGLEYVDLYLIHWPGHDTGKRKDAWRALQDIQKGGKTKSIGVSNYGITELKEVLATSDTVPAVNQIEFHPYIYEEQRPILEFCKQHKITTEAYSPLSQGRGLDSITIRDIAERSGKTPAQVMLRWAIQHGTIPIPKSVTPDRIRDNIKIFDFELSAEDMELLDQLS